MTPHHLVLATALISDYPLRPEFEDEASFKGQIYHSSNHKSASLTSDLANKRVAIIGAGPSGFDIAQDFANCGAKGVTLIQRSPLFVASLEAQEKFVLPAWKMMPLADADLTSTSMPLSIALTLMVGATQMMAQHDAQLLSGLETAGLSIKKGEDGMGLLHHQLLKGGHFYIDQGAGQMILDGRIEIERCLEGVRGFEHDAVILADDTRIEADVVVVATGLQPLTTVAQEIMGEEFLTKIGKLGQLDEENERIAVSVFRTYALGLILIKSLAVLATVRCSRLLVHDRQFYLESNFLEAIGFTD